MRVLESIPESLPCHAAGPGVFRQRWRRGWRWAEGARCCCCSRVMGPSSRGRCSPGRGSWSFAATPGWAGCSGWSCWKQWNASENRSPRRHSLLPGRHFLGPCPPKTASPLTARASAAALHCSSLRRILSSTRCRSAPRTLLRGHCWRSWSDRAQGGTW